MLPTVASLTTEISTLQAMAIRLRLTHLRLPGTAWETIAQTQTQLAPPAVPALPILRRRRRTRLPMGPRRFRLLLSQHTRQAVRHLVLGPLAIGRLRQTRSLPFSLEPILPFQSERTLW